MLPIQTGVSVWRTFLEFELAGLGPVADNNGCLVRFKLKKECAKHLHYLQELSKPIR
jgi:hypothetical protein